TYHGGLTSRWISVDYRCVERTQLRVVTDLELLHRDRFFLVHDRQDAEPEEGVERVAGVEVARAVADILRCQQHLPHRDPVAREGGLVLPHERRLADGRRGLLLRNGARPRGEPEARPAGCD